MLVALGVGALELAQARSAKLGLNAPAWQAVRGVQLGSLGYGPHRRLPVRLAGRVAVPEARGTLVELKRGRGPQAGAAPGSR